MSRWTYLVPRTIIASLILLSVWLGKDPLIRKIVIQEAQNFTGAKVEIAQVRTSFSTGKLFLKDIKIADPRDPMRNLLQAEMAYVQLDLKPLLRRKIVIEEGQTHRLMFGAPRTVSGLLAPNKVSSLTPIDPLEPRDFNAESAKIGQAWLDQFQPDRTILSDDQFEVLRLVDRSRNKWDLKIESLLQQVATLNPRITQVRRSLVTEHPNLLRDPVRYAQSASELAHLTEQASGLRGDLDLLRQHVLMEKNNLLEAQQRDEQKLNQLSFTNQFEGDSVSELLLHQSQGRLVEEVVQWFRWFRSSIPTTDDMRQSKNGGVNVAFKSLTTEPGFLIKTLDLEGEGYFAGQHLNFAGTAYDLSTEPSRHSKPASIELRAQGNQHVNINCVIDRRTDQPVDTLTVRCPDLPWEAQPLGHEQSLLISMGPESRLQAKISIQAKGENLSGTLAFQHTNVSLHVDQLHELAGGTDTALRINQDLVKVNKFKSTVTLAGTLDQYNYRLESDLGNQFVSTVDNAIRTHQHQQIQRLANRLQQIVAGKLKYLDEEVAVQLEKMSNDLQRDIHRMAELKQSIEAPQNQTWPKIR